MWKNWITTIFGILTMVTTIVGIIKQQIEPAQAISGLGAGAGLIAAKDAINKKTD